MLGLSWFRPFLLKQTKMVPDKTRSPKTTAPAAMPPFAPTESDDDGTDVVVAVVAVGVSGGEEAPPQKNEPPTSAAFDSC